MKDTGFHVAFRFVLAALAVWRVSFMFSREEGPWEVLARFRRGLGRGALGKLFGCVKCLSVWVAIPFAIFVGGTRVDGIVVWLALSGVASLIDEWTRPGFEWKEQPDNDLLRRNRDRDAQ